MSEQTKLYPRGRAKAELNRRLCILASWLQSRVAGEHNANTTLTMLERKTKEIVAAYHSDCDGPEVPTPLSPGAQAIQDGITRGKILRGPSFVCGVPAETKPIVDAPPGQQRLSFRPGFLARLRVRTPDGIREFSLHEKGDSWAVAFEFGRNSVPGRKGHFQ